MICRDERKQKSVSIKRTANGYVTRYVRVLMAIVATAILIASWKQVRADFTFGTPINLGPIVNRGPNVNSPYLDVSAGISSDGLALYFASDRPGGYGGMDLYVATRQTTDDDWGDPVNLGPVVNSWAYEDAPSISPDGLSLYFSDGLFLTSVPHRPGGYGGGDIWVTTRESVDDEWGPPVNLGNSVNSSSYEGEPEIAPDGLTLFFDSKKPGGYGNVDLWITTRPSADAPWGPSVNFGSSVNTSGFEGQPSISSDGLTLYLCAGDYRGHANAENLWATTRPSTTGLWGTPVRLSTLVNMWPFQASPEISPDGLSLYFVSALPGSDSYDLFVSTRESTSDPFEHRMGVSGIDANPRISANGLELYFASDRPGGIGNGDVWVATRDTTEDEWGEPTNLGPQVNSKYDDILPFLTADGLELYISSNRPGTYGWLDIWVSKRTSLSDPWQSPVNLGSPINASSADDGQVLTEDGLSMYYCSCYQNDSRGRCDLYVTTRNSVNHPWQTPVNLGYAVNSAYQDWTPSVTPNGNILLFGSSRPVSSGGWSIWFSRRTGEPHEWSAAREVGPAINTSFEQASPYLSPDGSTLYFQSNRPGEVGGWDIWKSKITPIVDFNGGDGVDFRDFSQLADYWLSTESSADIAPLPFGDDKVDWRDVAVLAGYWLDGSL